MKTISILTKSNLKDKIYKYLNSQYLLKFDNFTRYHSSIEYNLKYFSAKTTKNYKEKNDRTREIHKIILL